MSKETRVYTKQEAVIDLLFITPLDCGVQYIKGDRFEHQAGELIHSLRFLADRWQWSKNKVIKLLNNLEMDGFLISKKDSKGTHKLLTGKALRNAEVQKRDSKRTHTISIKDNNIHNNNNNILESKEKESFYSFRDELIKLKVPNQYIEDWLKIRKKKGGVDTLTAWRGFISQVKLSNMNLSEVVKMCAENGWRGFHADWKNNNLNNIHHATPEQAPQL